MQPRIRTIKPEFFKHEELFDLEQETGLPIRVAFAGLFTIADREGRFQWRPRTLKSHILPHDNVDFSRVLHALVTREFLVRYAWNGELFGAINTFKKHQVVNNKEKASELPSPDDKNSRILNDFTEFLTREPRVTDACLSSLGKDQVEGKGREGKGREVVGGPTATEIESIFENDAAREPDRGGTEKTPAAPTEKSFQVIAELRGDALLEEVLSRISTTVQRGWIEKYDRKWLCSKLRQAVDHYLVEEKALKPAQVERWGVKLVGWLNRERKPRLVNPGLFGGPSESYFESDEYIFGEDAKSAPEVTP
jgi:hypothetical protein